MVRKNGSKSLTAAAIVAFLAILVISALVSGCSSSSNDPDGSEKSVEKGAVTHASADIDETGSSKDTGAEHEDSSAEGEADHADGPPEERQGAHEISDEQMHEVLLQVLDGLLIIETVTTSTDVLAEPLARTALTQYQTAIKEDVKLGRYKVRDFQDIKLRFRNYTGNVGGVTLEYTDDSYYADLETHKPITEKKIELRRLLLSVQKLDGRWKIMAFFEPAKKPSAEQIKETTTTSVPTAVDKISEDLGYN